MQKEILRTNDEYILKQYLAVDTGKPTSLKTGT